ncbi:MAG TPA: TonB-dependent receptor [Candidatus Solibacter sp.]|nr:TonB-dependent receptor [Candidatus Solibacter sp.]
MHRAILVCLLTCAGLHAQTDSASVRILATDASGLAIADTSVALINTATGVKLARTTAADGYAMFTPVPPGRYSVEVSKAGFQQTRVTDVALDVAERKLVRVAMSVAAVTSTVEVSASAEIVQSEDGSLGQVIPGNVATELPLAGRRYTELALLVPGATEATLDPTTRGTGWFVANGNYQTQNNYTVDGVDNNQGTTNAQSLSAQVVQPSPDAIGEFKVQTNSYSAEFGRSAGAVVNVVLKSGTNKLHGSGWYYNRNKELAATPWAANLIGAAKPDLNWNQFGATAGGPIRKNKLFYFADYEGFIQHFANQFIYTVPTAAEHGGVFYKNINDPLGGTFPNRTIPANRLDVLGKKVIDLYPAANQPGVVASSGQTIQNYGVQANGRENTHKSDLKADYNFSEKDVFSARWSYHRQDIFRDSPIPGLADCGSCSQGAQFNTNHNVGATWTHTITPSVINFLRFGFTQTYATFSQASAGEQSATDFGFKGIPAQSAKTGGIPLMNVSSYQSIGVRNFRPQYQKPSLFQFIDNISLTRGAHSLRAGFETRQKNNTFLDSQRTVPAYTFNANYTSEALADLLLGEVYQFDANTQAVVEQIQKVYSAFFQDDWKVARNFTLNLGLRYDYTTPFYGARPNMNINFDPKTGQLVYAKNPTDYTVATDHKDFGPRIGLAWQIKPNKIVMRGGYGIFYSGEDMSGSDVNLPLNPPQLTPVTIIRQGTGPAPFLLSQPIPSGIFDNYDTTIISLRAREADYKSALIQQFNVALQFLLPMKSTFEVAYVGNRGGRLFAQYAGNQTPFGVDGSIAANRPFPKWAQIQFGSQRAESWYNALQLKWEKRMTHGWYGLFSYTFASALDEAGAWGAGSSPQYRDDFRSDRGPQAQTARHRATLSSIYDLPLGRGRRFGAKWSRPVDAVIGGWQLAGIVGARAGLPINIGLNGTATNPRTKASYRFFSRNGGGLRPDRVGDPNTGINPEDDRFHFLDPLAFSVQPVNTPGNSSRNVAVGPNAFTTSLSLVKHFKPTESSMIDLRFEAFNAFNRVNFGNPAATYPNSDFGTISSAGDPRIIQTAIRFRF